MPKPILSQGYGIMPNVILFDKELSSTAKLMCCYLMSLSAATGTCRPRNKHLSEKFEISTRQVTKVLEELVGYIHLGQDENLRRVISLSPEFTDDEGGRTKVLGGTNKSSIHSNINSIEKEITSKTQASIDKIYKAWLVYMVIDPDVRSSSDTESRHAAYLQAKKHTRLTELRKAKIVSRLADAGEPMILKAIKNISQSEFHRNGSEDSKWTAKLEWLCKSYEKVEEWANK